ncbi:hypothetical protein [Dongia sp.]|uniref:hypothetical protein n=1 Tax=Dongia sp. TaxID=1977262 RepID=UPI0035B4032B
MRWIAEGIVALLWFSPIAFGIAALPADAGDEIDLAPAVWADYQIYLKNLGTDAAYYAVTEDGLGGAPSGCALTKCLPNAQGTTGASSVEALTRCEDISPPSRSCVIFAEGDDIVVDFEMRDY